MKLLVFDFDGTLADTNQAILATIARTLAELGRQAGPGEDFTPSIGLPLARIFEQALESRDEQLIARAVRIYRERFPENCQTSVRLFPGVRQGLAELRDAGHLLAIASSRGKSSLLALTELLGISADFVCIAGEEDVERPKPAPDMADLVARQTGILPTSAMFIGDTAFDIVCGRAAGMATCGAAYGNHSRAQLLAAGADAVIDRFSELPALIRQRRFS